MSERIDKPIDLVQINETVNLYGPWVKGDICPETAMIIGKEYDYNLIVVITLGGIYKFFAIPEDDKFFRVDNRNYWITKIENATR